LEKLSIQNNGLARQIYSDSDVKGNLDKNILSIYNFNFLHFCFRKFFFFGIYSIFLIGISFFFTEHFFNLYNFTSKNVDYLKDFYKSVATPLLWNMRINYGNAKRAVRSSKKLFRGEEIVIVGKLEDPCQSPDPRTVVKITFISNLKILNFTCF